MTILNPKNNDHSFSLSELLIGLTNPAKLTEINCKLNTPALLISQNNLEKNLNPNKRYSFLCANPTQQQVFTSQKDLNSWKKNLSKTCTSHSESTPIPFHSGWLGYFSYPQEHTTTIAEFNYYPWVICLDHQTGTFHLLGSPDNSAHTAFAWLLEAQNEHSADSDSDSDSLTTTKGFEGNPFKASPFKSLWNKHEYQEAFNKVQDYLLAGDCYQVNLTQPFISMQYTGSSRQAILPLIKALKPNFGCYFEGQDFELLSMSPERFIKIDNDGKLQAKPIKGTIKRNNNPLTDKALTHELLNSEKNKAENLMIVDLLRNDLGKSAAIGTVSVEKLFELESQPNVHHLVSTINAQLKPDISAADALLNAFPGGSITGAPKKRAMEIIDELEVQPRSLYCGSFGYFSDTGHTDFNILIRSLEFRDGNITCWGGGGITIESECDDEYAESITKIQRIMDVIESIGKE